MSRNATFEDVLKLVRQLSPVEQVRLIERIAPEIERELFVSRSTPGVSLLGILKDLGPAPTLEEIDAARSEAWADFARNGA